MRRTRTLALLLVLAACKREPPPAPAAPTPPPAPAVQAPAPAPAAPAPEPTWGEPDGAKVKKLFRSRFAEVKRCYEAELQTHPDARGKLTLRFTIAEDGALHHVAVARSTFKRDDVPRCVVSVVRRWATPFRPGDPVEVEYPLSFTPR